ncbi:MAG: hypothetical protein ABI690_04895 [Chloroflexota bacterium]
MSAEQMIAEKWVNTGEAAEITGYDQQYLQKLALKNARLPEDERVIRVNSRAGRHEMWLPDLLKYIAERGHGPKKAV